MKLFIVYTDNGEYPEDGGGAVVDKIYINEDKAKEYIEKEKKEFSEYFQDGYPGCHPRIWYVETKTED